MKNKIIFAQGIIKTRLFGKRIPLVVGWSLTNRCNWNCVYCGRREIESGELTAKQISQMIGEFSLLGTRSINFTGGEPCIRDDIGEIINYAKNKNMHVTLTTNGSLIAEKIAEVKNIDTLILSYDGPEEVHDMQRQRGAYKSLLSAAKAAREAGFQLKLHTVLTKNNVAYLDSILDFAAKFNAFAHFTTLRTIPYSREEAIDSLSPSLEEYKLAIQNLILKKKNGNRHIGNSTPGLKYLLDLCNGIKSKIICCAGKIYCRIESNGDIYPCGELLLQNKGINCLKYGSRKAFAIMCNQGIQCGSCRCDSRIELNHIYALNLSAIFNMRRIFAAPRILK